MKLLQSISYRVGNTIYHSESDRNFILIGETTNSDAELVVVMVTDSEYKYDPEKYVWVEDPNDLRHYERGHNTGLEYQFTTFDKAEQDYQNGLFIPYFDIR